MVPRALAPAAPAPLAPTLPVNTTVIVPTRNESGNVAELVRRLDQAFGGDSVEILFVDDSTDDTPDTIRRVAAESRRAVRLIHRPPAERTDGLSGAVVAGVERAWGRWIVVMDGDLQHPPELAPTLAATGEREDADLVVATRYDGSGDAGGLDGRNRRAVSSAATTLARVLFQRRLRGVSDPMSGFFAIRRDRIDVSQLRPHGFKILLELLVRTPNLQVREVGFTFGARASGTSKASLREGARYVKHLCRLRLGLGSSAGERRPSTPARMLLFALVGASGIGINALALWALVTVAHLTYLLGAAVATQASTTWNWAFTEWLVFPGRKPRTPLRRYLAFSGVNNGVLLLRLPVLALLVSVLGVHYLIANVLTLAVAFVGRFVMSDRVIYGFVGSMS